MGATIKKSILCIVFLTVLFIGCLNNSAEKLEHLSYSIQNIVSKKFYSYNLFEFFNFFLIFFQKVVLIY